MSTITLTHELFARMSDSARAEVFALLASCPAPVSPVPSVPPSSDAPTAPAKGKKAKKPKDPNAPKREQSAAAKEWFAFVQETVADMKANGWPSWTDSKGITWAASELRTITDDKGNRDTFVFADTEKEVSNRNGGLQYASHLKGKAAEGTAVPDSQETVAEVAAAPASAKRRGPKKLEDMTPEERAAHDAKKAAKKAAKLATA